MGYVCVHGHFYQPPRENPSLEAIEVQDSAYPYHDWNERVCAECYAPNALSRILDDQDRVIELVNNYAHMSFNFGPTLLSWMEEKAPKVYESIQQADKLSRSGLAAFFNGVEIVPEKDPATYHAVIARRELRPHTSWMIGNSPKSDINPALAAGLHAVFLFHKDTWTLEHAEIDAPPKGQHLIELDSFSKLASIF